MKRAPQAKIAKNTKTIYFLEGVHGHSRSSMLVPSESMEGVLVKLNRKFVFICNRIHARRVDSGKLTTI